MACQIVCKQDSREKEEQVPAKTFEKGRIYPHVLKIEHTFAQVRSSTVNDLTTLLLLSSTICECSKLT